MEQLFDEATAYEAMLNKGIGLSGENKDFFVNGRLNDLCSLLPKDFNPENILDFGCGTGETTQNLAIRFPKAKIFGSEIADGALQFANQQNKNNRITFIHNDSLKSNENKFDLVYTNGVFHHIPPTERAAILSIIFETMRPNSYFGFFENNPFNPGTKIVMSRIPFDRDAITIPYKEGKEMLQKAGFQMISQHFLFYFPKTLSIFRPLEKYLIKIPLGAQYHLLVKKNL